MRGKELQMARIDKAPDLEKGKRFNLAKSSAGYSKCALSEQQKQQQSSRGCDDDNEMEL